MRFPRQLSLPVLIPAALGLVVALSCAHQVAPGGGEPDETPPRIRTTVPLSGEVNVDRNRPIVFVFSEWIEPRSARKSVSMFPPPEDGFEVNVSGRKLELVPGGPLAKATTYHVEITTALQDLRGNAFGTPYHLILSTGDQLDSGEVSGCVIDPFKRVVQPKVALFTVSPDSEPPDTALFSMPSYLTQTDSSGRFALTNIRPGHYELIAFEDDNNNSRLDPARENKVYAPPRRRIRLDSLIENLTLYPVLCDTTARTVVSVMPIAGTAITGEWIRSARSATDSLRADSLQIVPLDSTGNPVEIKDRITLPGDRFILRLSDTLSLAPYGLVCPISFVVEPPDSIARSDTIRFNGVRFADTTAPQFTGWRPRTGTRLLPHITLSWSEPVRLEAPRLTFADTLGDTVAAVAETTFTETTTIVPARRFLPGRRYQASIPCSVVVDLGGNHPADTTDSCWLTITLASVQADELCLSLSGRGTCLGDQPNRMWRFRPFGFPAPVTTADSAGHFRFDSLPAGEGTLARFVDSNGDGQPTAGSLLPWIAPEPHIPYYDTVEARARWDIEGVSVDACNPCRRGQEIRTLGSESRGDKPR